MGSYLTITWTDGQPNVFAGVECDQHATIHGESVTVRYDAIGQVWWMACEHHPRFSQTSFATRDEARSAAEVRHYA